MYWLNFEKIMLSLENGNVDARYDINPVKELKPLNTPYFCELRRCGKR